MDDIDTHHEAEIDDLESFLGEKQHDPQFAAALADAEMRAVILRRLVDHRQSRRIPQKDVAAAMNTTQSAISELEGGGTDPRLSTLQRYARAVGLALAIDLEDCRYRERAATTHSVRRMVWLDPRSDAWVLAARVS